MHFLRASLSLVLAACTPEVIERPTPPQTVTASEAAQCEVDADCVPATCCRATTCVPRGQAPDCSGKACDDACDAGIDDVRCNGRCTCTQGKCGAVFRPNPKWTAPPPRKE